jgi:hypothetical protein
MLICLSLILLSLRLYIYAEVNSQKIILEQSEEKYQTPDFIAFKESVKRYNEKMYQINYFYKKDNYFNDILKSISLIERPTGLYLTDLIIDRQNNNIKATVSGFSKSRDDLLIFKSNIEKESKIKNISFSQESWIKPLNINFHLTFEISKDEVKK